MSLYFEFIKKSFQERYAYRFDLFITFIGTILALFVQINVWNALYKGNATINSISLQNMINYVIISTLVSAMTKSAVGNKIAEGIDTGRIVSDFTKPFQMKYYLWAEDLGNNSFNIMLIAPICLLFGFIFNFNVPIISYTFMYFIISLVFGICICFYINYILGLFAFWLQIPWFITWFLAAFNELFSGSTVPLWFYPEWLRQISEWLPFKFIYFEPISIFLGKYSPKEEINVILLQIVWLTALVIFEKLIWRRAQNKIIIHGG